MSKEKIQFWLDDDRLEEYAGQDGVSKYAWAKQAVLDALDANDQRTVSRGSTGVETAMTEKLEEALRRSEGGSMGVDPPGKKCPDRRCPGVIEVHDDGVSEWWKCTDCRLTGSGQE